jgi:hypothetical protein
VMRHVQGVITGSTGISLRSEVQLLGFGSDIAGVFSDPRHDSDDSQAARQKLCSILGESR